MDIIITHAFADYVRESRLDAGDTRETLAQRTGLDVYRIDRCEMNVGATMTLREMARLVSVLGTTSARARRVFGAMPELAGQPHFD